MIIRDAVSRDKAQWLDLWQEFLAFYRHPLASEVTDHSWMRLMDPTCSMKIRLAAADETVLGFAIHQHHPSTWVMGDDCYLEDLFVAPAARGQGIGRALIDDLVVLARARGWHRLYWLTDADNAAARKLYDRFTPSDGHTRYRLRL